MRFKDLNIRLKILSGATLLVLITCIFGLLSFFYIGKISTALFTITNNNAKAVEFATGVERNALGTRLAFRTFMAEETPQNKQNVHSNINERRIQLASATPSKLNEKARWYSPLASPSNQRLRGVWAMHTLPGKNGTTSARQ